MGIFLSDQRFDDELRFVLGRDPEREDHLGKAEYRYAEIHDRIGRVDRRATDIRDRARAGSGTAICE